MPFMAGEGNAMDWVGDYSGYKNIIVSCNAPRMMREIKFYLKLRNNWTEEESNQKVVYLPNYYPQEYKTKKFNRDKSHIDIACFGAIRPLKNHLVQAFAAIEFADQIGKKLKFHVNAGRIEMNGSPVIDNLKGLFQHIYDRGHEMINHEWTPREQFLDLCSQMDIGVQVSFSETFNIVGADLISQGVPLVGTADEIPWAVNGFCADPNNSASICEKLALTYRMPWINVKSNQWSLTHYTNQTAKLWSKYFR